jgi:hypothetical protein
VLLLLSLFIFGLIREVRVNTLCGEIKSLKCQCIVSHKQWVSNINFFSSEPSDWTTYRTDICFRNVKTNVIGGHAYRGLCKYVRNLSIIHYHHHLANMELGHLLTRFGLTYPEVSSMVTPGSFCLLVCSFSLSSVICYVAFCLDVATNFFCICVFVQDWD